MGTVWRRDENCLGDESAPGDGYVAAKQPNRNLVSFAPWQDGYAGLTRRMLSAIVIMIMFDINLSNKKCCHHVSQMRHQTDLSVKKFVRLPDFGRLRA